MLCLHGCYPLRRSEPFLVTPLTGLITGHPSIAGEAGPGNTHQVYEDPPDSFIRNRRMGHDLDFDHLFIDDESAYGFDIHPRAH